MTSNTNKKGGRLPAIVGFVVFALVSTVSLAGQNPQDLTSTAKPAAERRLHIRIPSSPRAAGRTIRLRIAVTNNKGSASAEQQTEFDFKGANRTVTGLNATSERKTFKFERAQAGDAGLSCPTNKVKECDSVSLEDGGNLTACGCRPKEPTTTQTREHVLLARQVGVPAMAKEDSQPGTNVAAPTSTSSDTMSYSFALSDKSLLRATGGGGQTCWANKKLQMSICY